MKDIFGKEHEAIKIDTYQCIFSMDAQSIEEIRTMYKQHYSRLPGIKMIVSEDLNRLADFHTDNPDVIVLARSEFSNVCTGSYSLRNNDIVLYHKRMDMPAIFSCCGNIKLQA